ncbi:MAG: hypothetical protein JXR31_05115 [Prolixibacteraceae bacterium]|nr:hypothetical protein [Prolixibacteraceae bacterium]
MNRLKSENKNKNKTEKTKAMKTKNNVRKAILKSVAVITSLVLLSITVNAQGSFKELLADNSFGTIARVLSDNTSRISIDNSILTDEVTEPELQIEDWMISYSDYNGSLFNFEEDYEPELKLEDWMTEESFDNFSNTNEEEPLKLERWMLR